MARAAASRRRISSILIRRSRCGTTRRVPARSLTPWHGRAATSRSLSFRTERSEVRNLSSSGCGPKKREIPRCARNDEHWSGSSSRIVILRETHETPETAAWRLARAGGCNRFGEANYRAVWGWNRLAWIGGKFEERDPATGSLLREVVELRQEPKYPAVNRWHIEKWMPPETYGSPRAWGAQPLGIAGDRSTSTLGPDPPPGLYARSST